MLARENAPAIDWSTCFFAAENFISPSTLPSAFRPWSGRIHLMPHIFRADVSAVAIALGWAHTCVIVSGGGVKCWGANWVGQLGIGSRTDATSPADVAGDGCPPTPAHA